MTGRRLSLRLALAVPLVLAVAYGLGFVWFLRKTSEALDLPARADAIVVLTGGPDRIETGLRMLVAGRADKLLVSGLGGGATMPELARRAEVDPAQLAGRVTLGRSATTTRTNAVETARWVAEHNVHGLILVTAAYHMPRAMLELGRAMPGVAMYPAPVIPGLRGGRVPSWRLLLEEYTKWLIAAVNLSQFGPAHAPGPNPQKNTMGNGGAISVGESMTRDGLMA